MGKTFAEDDYFGSLGKASGGGLTFKRCYENHKPLPVGDGKVIYGGSCLDPIIKDADVYIGLDHGMKRANRWPWQAQAQVIEVFFPITDGQPPSNAEDFKKLVEWTALQLSAGKKVHAGCIGGHGRTGTLFAALVAHMSGETDAIQYVRQHYCPKVVESEAQVQFLMKHYGVSHAEPSKAHLTHASKGSGKGKGSSGALWPSEGTCAASYPSDGGKTSKASKPAGGKHTTVVPVKSHKDIWAGAVA